jgi:cysteine synthase A
VSARGSFQTQPTSSEALAVTPEVRAFVNAAIDSAETPVVVFALTWCEFTWSVRKLFARCGIVYRAIDLDSVEYQADDLGAKVRAADMHAGSEKVTAAIETAVAGSVSEA